MKIKLAYLVSHPIQYQAPLLREIARHPDIDLTVIFQSDLSLKKHSDAGFGEAIEWDVPLLEGYRHEFLPAFDDRNTLSFTRPLNYGLVRALRKGKYDALWLHGYSHFTCVEAILAAQFLGIKVLMRGESNLISRARGPAKRWIKDKLMRRLFGLCDGLLYIGKLNREYYRHYGVPDSKLFAMPYSVDNEFFEQRALAAAPKAAELRRNLNLDPDRPVILYASKLIERKHPVELLEAYIQLSSDGKTEPHPYLLFVGNGPELGKLKERAERTGWSSIRFLGFQNQTRLPEFYSLCDVFVLASSHETWGLVINEVMNAAKPVIVSDQVGSGADLVENGQNGFVVPTRDVGALAKALNAILARPEQAQAMGQQSLRKIRTWGFREDVEGLRAALRHCLGR